MIDWYNLILNATWILGCAVGLAVLSFTGWDAAVTGEKFRMRIKRPWIQIALNSGGGLFCIGLAGTSGVIWQQVLWILLAMGFAVQIGLILYQMKSIPRS